MSWTDKVTPVVYRWAKRMPWLRSIYNGLRRAKQLIPGRKNMPGPVESILDLKDILNTSEGEIAGVIDHVPVRDAWLETRVLPRSIDSESHWKFTQNATCEHPATFVLTLSNGRACGAGDVVTRDNRLLLPVSPYIEKGAYERSFDNHPIFGTEGLRQPHKLRGRALLLAAYAGRGFYHWMYDVLPRLQVFRDANMTLESVDHVLVNHYVSSFHMDTLSKLGVPRSKIRQLENAEHFEAEELIVPSLPGNTGQVPLWVCEFLRREFLSSKDKSQAPANKRIYISRTKAGHRQLENNDEIIKVLERFDFQIVHLEDIPISEQAHLMAEADVVVSPHGAGLGNIVFCRPGTKVIELFHHSAVNVMFWTIANAMELDYTYLLSEGRRPEPYVDPYLNTENMRFGLDALKKSLQLAGVDS